MYSCTRIVNLYPCHKLLYQLEYGDMYNLFFLSSYGLDSILKLPRSVPFLLTPSVGCFIIWNTVRLFSILPYSAFYHGISQPLKWFLNVYTLKFTNVQHTSIGFDKYIVSCIHYSIIYNSFTTLKNTLCFHPFNPPSSPQTHSSHWSFVRSL